MADYMEIRNPRTLGSDRLPVERMPLGRPGDYKPCVAKLPDGTLLIVGFDSLKRVGERLQEDMLLWRSQDGGRTWSERTVIPLLGREPYLSVLRDGTVFISVHFLEQDIRNKKGYVYSMLHRSTDEGQTWDTTEIGWEDVPGAGQKDAVLTGRNVLGLQDGTLIFGVGAGHGAEYLWRSSDGGASWDKTLKFHYEGVDPERLDCAILAETVYWQARAGDILALTRVDSKLFPPLAGAAIPQTEVDHFNRMVLYRSKDGGHHWALEELGSFYGEMYPSVLRLQDGRLLLTFTVRSVTPPREPPLGVQAVLGVETDDGFEFDFDLDRIVIDAKTPAGQMSGGGFGPTVQLDDGTLVTSYSYAGPGKWGHDMHAEVTRWRLP